MTLTENSDHFHANLVANYLFPCYTKRAAQKCDSSRWRKSIGRCLTLGWLQNRRQYRHRKIHFYSHWVGKDEI